MMWWRMTPRPEGSARGGVLIVRDFKQMDRVPVASARFRTIQICPKDLSLRLTAKSTTREQIKVAGDPRFDWAIRRCAMNMSVTQFVVPPAIVGRSRSVWHEIIDTVIEGPPRTAADEVAEYLARHQYDLSPNVAD
jgi:hypothetical protein